MTTKGLVDAWTSVLGKQLCAGSDFARACEIKNSKDIPFKIQMLTPGGAHELRQWEDELARLLKNYDFDLLIEHGVTLATSKTFDDADIVILLALTGDIETFCVDFAREPSRASKTIVCVPEGHDGKHYCRLARETFGVETITLPVQSMLVGAECRFGIDLVRKCADYLLEKVTATVRKLRIENTVVMLVHGIRTRGLWQGQVKQSLESAGLVAIPTNYNKFDVLRFLSPFERPKLSAVRRVEAEVKSAKKKFQGGHISILAHSFGTYIVGKLISSGNHDFDRIALCGSVLKSNFDFDGADGRFKSIVNEVGCQDVWPALAAKIAPHLYGPTGSFGFNCGNFVTDRQHSQFGHSTFLNAEFSERFWVPYFCDGDHTDQGDVSAKPSLLVRIVDSTWVTAALWILIFSAVVWPIWLLLPYIAALPGWSIFSWFFQRGLW